MTGLGFASKLLPGSRRRKGTSVRKPTRSRLELEPLEGRALLSANVLQTNLVSDLPGVAQLQDPHLVNPWGITESGSGVFWVSDNNAGVSTLYNAPAKPAAGQPPFSINPLVVSIPTPGDPLGATGAPDGTVFNIDGGATGGFTVSGVDKNGNPITASAVFLFATEDGTLVGWNPAVNPKGFDPAKAGTYAIIAVDNSGNNFTEPDPLKQTGAVYKGLSTASSLSPIFAGDPSSTTVLYAANFRSGQIEVYDPSFKLVTLPAGAFSDPNLPKDYAPFNVQVLDDKVYVTYAQQDAAGHDDVGGAGHGFVDVFNLDGTPGLPGGTERLVSRGALDSPWGLAIAPSSFGNLANDLLVGNFKSGFIDIYNPGTGQFLGQIQGPDGAPIHIDDLWALKVGNGGNGGSSNLVYFTAGLDDETHGLFGSLQAIPSLSPRAPIAPNLPIGALQDLTTVPANGDLNPYGVAFVPQGFPSGGLLKPGDVLVSNFNNGANQQGTGSTIVDISPNGGESLFFQDSAPSGLTTALGVLKSGFVIVGNLPATYDSNGNLVSVGQGSLRILDRNGNVVTTLTDSQLLDGPWDLTVNDQGDKAQVFVSNVLNGVVTRIDLSIPKGGDPIVESMTKIASGYLTRTDPAALVIGPTGLAYDPRSGALYVASTGDNEIFAIPNAGSRTSDGGTGSVVYKDDAHLRGPLGLVLAPNGDLITSNGDAVNPDPNQTSELVEFTPGGKFVGQFSIDPAAGAAFGLAATDVGGILRLASVEDSTNSLDVWTFQTGGKSSAHDDTAGLSAPAPAVLTSTSTGAGPGAGSQSQEGTSAGPVMSQASSPQPAPVTLMGTTDFSAGASASSSAPATSGHRKGAHHVTVALGDMTSTLIGHRHPRGPKSPAGGSTGDATNHPISDPYH
jgi:uncharacterized protein (TIGR03118 family)